MFDIPESLDGLNLDEVEAEARAEFDQLRQADGHSPEDVERAQALVSFVRSVQAERDARAERSASVNDLAGQMPGNGDSSEGGDDGVASADETATADEHAPAAPSAEGSATADGEGTEGQATPAASPVPATPAPATVEPAVPSVTSVAPATPSVSAVAAQSTAPNPVVRRPSGQLLAAVNLPGYREGDQITMADIGQVAETRLRQITSTKAGSIGGEYPIASLRREFPDGAVAASEEVAEQIKFAADQSKLAVGGVMTFQNGSPAGMGNAGWCAPSETLYDRFCPLPDVAGLLSLPEINATRGGVRWPETPDFCEVYNSAGFQVYTEAMDLAGCEKPCIEIPCPEFKECRLDAYPLCILGGLLMNNAYPEAVADYVARLLAAYAHWQNMQKIARIEANSMQIELPSTFGAAAALLEAIELAVTDLRDAYGISDQRVIELVLPHWARAVIRADMSRRAGCCDLNVTDAMINQWLATRGVAVQYVMDWQSLNGRDSRREPDPPFDPCAVESPSDCPPPESPTGDCPPMALTSWPCQIRFLIYPAGTWTLATTDIIDISTFFDSTLLSQNKYGIRFSEDGWCLMDNCPGSRSYTVPWCPDGMTGGQCAGLTCTVEECNPASPSSPAAA